MVSDEFITGNYAVANPGKAFRRIRGVQPDGIVYIK
jgi:hypothetical protein